MFGRKVNRPIRTIKRPIVKFKNTWHVKVEDSSFDLTFPNRKGARDYKFALLESDRKLKSEIVLHRMTDGFIEDEVGM